MSRFEFDKQVEARQSQLEERKLKQAWIDTWTRFIGTLLVGVLITGGVQWYSVRSEKEAKTRAESAQKAQKDLEEAAQRAQKDREEATQRAQVAIQLANAREKALSDLRAQMFNTLLQNYFKQAREQEQVAILDDRAQLPRRGADQAHVRSRSMGSFRPGRPRRRMPS